MIEEREWGSFELLYSNKNFWVKFLNVNPNSRLSLQKHLYREEIWHVLEGKGIATVNNQHIKLEPGVRVKIETEDIHRLECTSEKLKVLELAHGDDVREDDIIRIEDDFGRM